MAFTTYPLNYIDYDYEDAETWLATRSSGVFVKNDFAYRVTGTDTNITFGEGLAWIHNHKFAGKVFKNDSDFTVDFGVSDANYDRIDVAAIQFDKVANTTRIIAKHGESKTKPVIPAISQTEELYELYICSVHRKAGSTYITNGDITDLRLSPQYCGLMADNVTSIDTAAIYAQVTDLINRLEKEIAGVESSSEMMLKSVYDEDNDGIVDNSERLGGELPSYYAAAANVKLKILSAMTDLGLEATATFADTVAAVQNYTTVFLQPNSLTDASWNLPISQGYIQITRRYGTRQISVIAYSSLGEMHIATINTKGIPTGKWSKVAKQEELSEYMPTSGGKFTGDVTLASDPTDYMHPATKRYVDDRTNFKLIWSNPSPTSVFDAFSVTSSDYNADEYNFFIVLFRYSTSSTTTTSLVVMPNGVMHRVFFFGDIAEGAGLPCIYTRAVTLNSDGIVFGKAYYNYTDSISSVVDNTYLIPTHIYGAKLK